MSRVTAKGYLVLKGRRADYGPTDPRTGLKPVKDMRIVRTTVNYPTSVEPDEIVVRLRVDVPIAVFDPIAPDVVISIPEDMVDRGEIVVTPESPKE